MNKILEIKKEINKLEENKTGLLKKLDDARAKKKFKCLCGKFHQIKQCSAVHRTWEDYINEELWIICPDTEIANRMLFNLDYSIDYAERLDFEHNLEKQFVTYYKKLFKEVIEECSDEGVSKYKRENNYYIDEHHESYGLKRGKITPNV